MNSSTRVALGALALTLAATMTAAAQTAVKIGFVNSQKLLPQAPGFSDAQQTIETEREGVKAQEQKMSDSLAAMVQEYQKVQSTLTATVKATRESAIRAKQQEYQQRAASLEARAQQHEAEMIQPIMDQMRGIIEELRAEGGYAAILDIGTQTGVVVAIDSTFDITDRVLQKVLAAGPPKPSAKPATKAGTKPAAKPPAAAAQPTGVSRPPTPPRGR
jgi:outer membrane protein